MDIMIVWVIFLHKYKYISSKKIVDTGRITLPLLLIMYTVFEWECVRERACDTMISRNYCRIYTIYNIYITR